MEHCIRRHKVTVNPIIEWTDEEVWEFIKAEGIPYCALYDEGYKRLGCIGCPMASTETRIRDFKRWPRYEMAYLKAFRRMLDRRIERNKEHPDRPVWRSGGTDFHNPDEHDVMRWWLVINKD